MHSKQVHFSQRAAVTTGFLPVMLLSITLLLSCSRDTENNGKYWHEDSWTEYIELKNGKFIWKTEGATSLRGKYRVEGKTLHLLFSSGDTETLRIESNSIYLDIHLPDSISPGGGITETFKHTRR